MAIPTAITGTNDAGTEDSLEEALETLEIAGSTDERQTWMRFLEEAAKRGLVSMEPSPQEKSPLDLLHDLYSMVSHELAGSPLRKRFESALNAFANHDATQEWLERYR